jgi:hypothetical protein
MCAGPRHLSRPTTNQVLVEREATGDDGNGRADSVDASTISSTRVPELALMIVSVVSQITGLVADRPLLRFIPARLPLLRKAEISEGTGHDDGQPTHPERNAPAADLDQPPEDDSQEMRYRHREKQRGGHRDVGVSVQSACLSCSDAAMTTVARPRVEGCLGASDRGRRR